MKFCVNNDNLEEPIEFQGQGWSRGFLAFLCCSYLWMHEQLNMYLDNL